jgi:hypothetical protein
MWKNYFSELLNVYRVSDVPLCLRHTLNMEAANFPKLLCQSNTTRCYVLEDIHLVGFAVSTALTAVFFIVVSYLLCTVSDC